MGKSYTPTNRIELLEYCGANVGVKRQVMVYRGNTSCSALYNWIKAYEKSMDAGGVNQHIGKLYGFAPIVNQAEIINQKSGCVVQSYFRK